LYETSAPRVYLVRQNTQDERARERQDARLRQLRAASRSGPVAVVLDMAAGGGADSDLAAFWMRALEDREGDLAVLAVVTGSLSMRLATRAFAATAALRHLPVEVRAHPTADDAITWAAAALQRAAAARRMARMAQRA
jgi:hypothetical protein